ncbi:Spy/CpxP family protein refolding chaperone [Acidobacteriota bacterium]
MKKGRFIVTLVSAFIIISALPGFAQRDWQSELDPYYDLDLSSEQIAQIKKLEFEFQKEMLPLRMKLDTHDLELEYLYASGAEEPKIEAKIRQIEKIDLELDRKFMEHDSKIRVLLTDRQKVLFDQYRGFGWDYGRPSGIDPDLDYARGYGRGYDYGRGYGRGYGLANRRGYGLGYGRGYGRAYNRGYDYGRGDGRGYERDWDRRYKREYQSRRGYSREYERGLERGYRGNYSRGYGYERGPGAGRGFRCPYYRRGRFDRSRDWY